MKSLKSKIKNINGITLISLVITIIVLIILAGVTLNMLLGENGIINRTKTAKDENEKATATETMNLKITNVQISKYAEEQRMPTLKELADNFCEDDDFQYVQETSEVASLTPITNNNPTSIYTKLKAYPYEFEINSSLQLASIDGVKVATVPANDDNTIVSMTKKDLNDYIENAINTKLSNYYCNTNATTTSSATSSKPAIVVENYKNGTEWYRVWSDGWIEQGGHAIAGKTASGTKINLIKNYKDANYTINMTINDGTISTAGARSVICNLKETNGFYAVGLAYTSAAFFSEYDFDWYTCGY